MTENDLYGFFLQEKPNRMLKHLRISESHGSELATKIDTTYAHTVKLISKLRDHDLIETRKKGRKRIVSLTEEGETIADAAVDYMQTLKEVESGLLH